MCSKEHSETQLQDRTNCNFTENGTKVNKLPEYYRKKFDLVTKLTGIDSIPTQLKHCYLHRTDSKAAEWTRWKPAAMWLGSLLHTLGQRPGIREINMQDVSNLTPQKQANLLMPPHHCDFVRPLAHYHGHIFKASPFTWAPYEFVSF